jgi:AhpD family alkylhydroperoxidase
MKMANFPAIEPQQATGAAVPLLEAVQKKLGIVPNMTRVMANAPAVLEGYLGLSGALGHGVLKRSIGEQIALRVAQVDGCDYCLSAHTAIGKMTGLAPEQITASRDGHGTDARATAALVFSTRLLETKGHVTQAEIAAALDAGLNEAELLEVVAHVALNVFTNFFNVVAGVVIDFPRVSASAI